MARRITTAVEANAYGPRDAAWMAKPGAVKGVKRTTHKRERREALEDIRAVRNVGQDDR